jgi:hypothetical protein
MAPGRDDRSPVDQLLDLVVYAPIGLLMNLDELLPQLVEKGHQQVDMARVFGKFAVSTGTKEARKRLDGMAGGRRSPSAAPTPTPETAARPDPSAQPVTATTEPAVDPALLGIPDYDALSASQVVPRLGGLGEDELEAVRRYETANRGRKTILARIAQLQG